MNSALAAVPDLLRRFVAAPHSARIIFGGGICATVRTNDLQLLTEMQHTPAASVSVASSPTIRMTIIRDPDAPRGGTAFTHLSAWPLTTLFVGWGTVLTLDSDSRELLGFLAPSITASELMNRLLPTLLEPLRSLTNQQTLIRLTDER